MDNFHTLQARSLRWKIDPFPTVADAFSEASTVHPLKLTVRTWKWMVGMLLSFWEGPFSGAMFVLGVIMSSQILQLRDDLPLTCPLSHYWRETLRMCFFVRGVGLPINCRMAWLTRWMVEYETWLWGQDFSMKMHKFGRIRKGSKKNKTKRWSSTGISLILNSFQDFGRLL